MKRITFLPFRRKQHGLTNYRKRLALLKGKLPRAVVRKSLKNIIIQLVIFGHQGDKVLLHADSKELPKYGWVLSCGNIPAAYLTGYLFGIRAKKKKIMRAFLDIGIHASTKGGRVYAALKGMVDAGIGIPHSTSCLPDEARILGQHIQNYARLVQEKKEINPKQFAHYHKINADITTLGQSLAKTKQRLETEDV